MKTVTAIRREAGRFLVTISFAGREETCRLYSSEVRGLKEGTSLTPEEWNRLFLSVKKRAWERSLYLLDARAYTEKQMREKLEKGGYWEEVIEVVLLNLKDKHYLDDEAYAKVYWEEKSAKEGQRRIKEKLWQKGISLSLSEEEQEKGRREEIILLQKTIEKRKKNRDYTDPLIRKKEYASLLRKGFSPDSVRKALEEERLSAGLEAE